MTDEIRAEQSAEFTVTRRLDAPRDVVWRAWTDPKELAHWLFPHGATTPPESISAEVRVGGAFRYTMIADDTGEKYPTECVYLEVVEPERLQFTWAEPGVPIDSAPVATVTLLERDEQTELIFHLRGIAGRPGDDDVHDGWSEALDNLAAHLGET